MSASDATPFLDITLGNVLTWIISFTIIVGALWKAKSWQEKREREKADALIKRTEDVANALLKKTEDVAAALKEYTDRRHEDVLTGIDEMQNRLGGIISDLRDRADLTNGNVSNIRTDIADLQEDLLELWESQLSLSKSESTPAPQTQIETIADKKRQALERRKKRRQIEVDRVQQNEQAMGVGKRREGEAEGRERDREKRSPIRRTVSRSRYVPDHE
jgi:hypothetical protein